MGNVTPRRAEYLRAIVYYGSQDLEKAKAICLRLINKDHSILSKKSEEDTDSVTTLRAYVLLSYVARCMSNTAEIIRYASEAIQMAHNIGDVTEEARMSSLIAEVQSKAGLTDDAIEQLSKTREKVKSINSYPGVNAYFSVSKRLMHVLSDNKRFDEMVTVGNELLEHINHFAEHTSEYDEISEGLDLSEFIDLARGQTYAFLTAAYAEMGNRTEALKNERLMRQAKWSNSVDGDRLMVTIYAALGEWQKMDEAFARLDSVTTDTLSINFLTTLLMRSDAAEKRGLPAQAMHYLQRAFVIKDSVVVRDTKQKMEELATNYHLHEEQFARKEAESKARLYLLCAIAAVAFAAYFFYERHQIALKNKALVRLIDGQKQLIPSPMEESLDTSSAEDSAEDGQAAFSWSKDGEGLFSRFTSLIYDEHLYRDALLDRETVCQRLDIDRHTLNQLLNDFAEGLSLPAYINKVRLNVACQQLREDPEKSIADIADAVGFNQRNFRTQFKNLYGISPTEYRNIH